MLLSFNNQIVKYLVLSDSCLPPDFQKFEFKKKYVPNIKNFELVQQTDVSLFMPVNIVEKTSYMLVQKGISVLAYNIFELRTIPRQ